MRKYLILTVLALILITTLVAQALSVDSRKVPIQAPDTFSTLRISCPADTVYRSVTVPAHTWEAWIISETGAVHVNTDSLYTEVSGNKRYVSVPAAVQFSLPVKTVNKFWIRRAAAGTATTVNIIWKRI